MKVKPHSSLQKKWDSTWLSMENAKEHHRSQTHHGY